MTTSAPELPFLWWRFDAPLMSFGGAMIDNYGITRRYPATSMITGLLGNALGWHHRDTADLQALQGRLIQGARADAPGVSLKDYQTVDLGQPHLSDKLAWTTRGRLESRAGGNSTGTHIRYRDYLADAVYTVVIGLRPGEGPGLEELEQALKHPARPLFIGRKGCLPASPIWPVRLTAGSVSEALHRIPLSERYARLHHEPPAHLDAWWSSPHEEHSPEVVCRLITDERDWANQVHVGQRWLSQGRIATAALPTGETGANEESER